MAKKSTVRIEAKMLYRNALKMLLGNSNQEAEKNSMVIGVDEPV